MRVCVDWLSHVGRRDNSASAGGRGHSAGGHGDLTLGQEEWHNIGDVIAKVQQIQVNFRILVKVTQEGRRGKGEV